MEHEEIDMARRLAKRNASTVGQKLLLGFTALVIAGCGAIAATPTNRPSVVVAFEDAPFVPDDPRFPAGPGVAVLHGDPSTGPSAMLISIRRGSIPLHTHSSDYHLLVVRGTVKHWDEGGTEAAARPLGPGSYWFQPADQVHGDACVADECVAYLVWSGKRDGKLAPARP
jgi:quercetin dioxygenase-like cupin family protein